MTIILFKINLWDTFIYIKNVWLLQLRHVIQTLFRARLHNHIWACITRKIIYPFEEIRSLDANFAAKHPNLKRLQTTLYIRGLSDRKLYKKYTHRPKVKKIYITIIYLPLRILSIIHWIIGISLCFQQFFQEHRKIEFLLSSNQFPTINTGMLRAF